MDSDYNIYNIRSLISIRVMFIVYHHISYIISFWVVIILKVTIIVSLHLKMESVIFIIISYVILFTDNDIKEYINLIMNDMNDILIIPIIV